MRLRQFAVQGFAQLRDVDVAFRDDAPNVVFGLNEAGKSHLMQALFGMFFPVDNVSELIPWQGPQTMRGTLEFVDAGERIVRLEREFRNNDVWVTMTGQEPWKGKVKGSTTDALHFAECLEEWFGFRDRELFASTTFVRQADVIMQANSGDRRGLAAQVKQLITGTQETNYDKVLADLDKQLNALRMAPGARTPRQLEQRQAELGQLREEVKRAEDDHARYAEIVQKLTDTERTVTEKRAEVGEIEAQLKGAQELINAEANYMEARKRFDEADSARRRLYDLEKQLAPAQRRCEELAIFEGADQREIEQAQKHAAVARARVDELGLLQAPDLDRLARLEQAVDAADGAVCELPPWPAGTPIEQIREAQRAASHPEPMPESPPSTSGSINWLVVLALCAGGIVLGFLVHPILYVLVAAAGLYALVARSSGRAPSADSSQDDLAGPQQRLDDLLAQVGATSTDEAERLWQRREAAVQHAHESRTDLDEELHRLGVATAADARRATSRLDEARAESQRADGTLARLLHTYNVSSADRAIEDIAELGKARSEVNRIKTGMSMLGTLDHVEKEWQKRGSEQSRLGFRVETLLDDHSELMALEGPEKRAAHVATARNRREQLNREIETAWQEEDALRRQQADLGSVGIKDIPVLLDEVRAAETDVARLERRARALEVAASELRDAVSHFRDHCLGDVMVDTSGFLQKVTEGRYVRVDVASDDLAPSVMVPGGAIAVNQLSRGVQDQLYFALRVALARAITRGRTLPLVLDDPFVNFDPVRRQNVIDLLGDLVDRTQVLLFTCDPSYCSLIEPVLELPSPEIPDLSQISMGVA